MLVGSVQHTCYKHNNNNTICNHGDDILWSKIKRIRYICQVTLITDPSDGLTVSTNCLINSNKTC